MPKFEVVETQTVTVTYHVDADTAEEATEMVVNDEDGVLTPISEEVTNCEVDDATLVVEPA